MTENTTRTAAQYLLDAEEAAGARIDFDPAALELHDVETFRMLARNAVSFLSDEVKDGDDWTDDDDDENENDDTPDSFEPLSLDIYRNDHGDYIADVDLTVGGPTIYARYESRWGRVTLTAAWGADRLECTSKRCPLIDWIESAEECSRL